MKTLVHIRHSIRHKPGVHLNQQGIELAQKVGQTLPSFDYVVTSYIERAWETAMVMGYAVNEMRPELFVFGDRVNKEIGMNETYSFLKERYDEQGAIYKFAHFQINFINEMLDKIEDDQSLLLVSHGLIIDIPLITMFPHEDHSKWGNILSYCEGYKLQFGNGTFANLEFLRINA